MYKLTVYQPKHSYQDAKTCGECGGACCQSMPGITHPEQFGAPNRTELVKNLISILSTPGLWAIDWWDGDPRDIEFDEDNYYPQVYYIRAAVKGVKILFHPTYGGECALLTELGCMLKPDNRPFECKTLKPIKDSSGEIDCKQQIREPKRTLSIAWLKYQDEILIAAEKVKGEMVR